MADEQDETLERIRKCYPPVLTTAQVAELLDLNPRTVMNMANDGRLPASRIAGSRKFHYFLDDIISALRDSRVEPTNIADHPA